KAAPAHPAFATDHRSFIIMPIPAVPAVAEEHPMPHSAARSKAVLVTGCSTGIGKAIAARLAGAGWTVYATARKPETLEDLKASGCRTLALDVNDEASMQAAVSAVEDAHGAVGVLINNAGYSQSGAVESVPLSRVRAQFETNVFGLIRMCQLVLPGMRRQGWGRIVNMGSMGGKLTFPGGGIYHASKYAVEALSDALRFEVRGFGVDVVLIQPGLIRSRFSATAGVAIDAVQADAGPYREFNTAVAKASRDVYETGLLARLGGEPERVAATIEKVLRSARPKARYAVTPSARLMMTQRALMGDGMWDRFLRSNFPSPGAGS
ncbi:SDR family NAD(P)-dependent oxidoreductase, partial [Dyella sp.]|uniref:SDR family NAD(P)-dependent oxidoreductase n=1 Tax=Dyella sp. TaxID=1869338 RepID=UPI002D7856BD